MACQFQPSLRLRCTPALLRAESLLPPAILLPTMIAYRDHRPRHRPRLDSRDAAPAILTARTPDAPLRLVVLPDSVDLAAIGTRSLARISHASDYTRFAPNKERRSTLSAGHAFIASKYPRWREFPCYINSMAIRYASEPKKAAPKRAAEQPRNKGAGGRPKSADPAVIPG